MSSPLRHPPPPPYPPKVYPPLQQQPQQYQSASTTQLLAPAIKHQLSYPNRTSGSATWSDSPQRHLGSSPQSSMSPPSYLASAAATSAVHTPSDQAFRSHAPTLESAASVASNAASAAKRPTRDTKRRATHSQIERRRREKINDRLITLRNLVPACAREVELKRRTKDEEDAQAAGAANGLDDESGTKGKRKRTRRKPAQTEAAKAKALDKDEELGLHKLEVLTHAIEYIYELRGRIEELETGKRTTVLVPPLSAAASDAGDGDENDVEMEADGNESLAMSDYAPQSRPQSRLSSANGAATLQLRRSRLVAMEMDEDEDDPDKTEGDEPEERSFPSMLGRNRVSPPTPSSEHWAHPHTAHDSFGGSVTGSSSNNSPMLMSVSQDSPLFSSNASTTSLGSAFTSPMMSLSSNSPLLTGDPGKPRSSRSTEGRYITQSSSCKSAPNALGGRRPSIQNGHLWPMLPAAALSLSNGSAPVGKATNESHGPVQRGGLTSPISHPHSRSPSNQITDGRIQLPELGWAERGRGRSGSISTSSLDLAPLSASSPPMGTFDHHASASGGSKLLASTAAHPQSTADPLTTTSALALSSCPPSTSSKATLSETPAAAAALLLSISTSPDAIRPTTTVPYSSSTSHSSSTTFPSRRPHSRSSSFSASRIVVPLQSPTTLTAAQTARPSNVRAELAPASAPGGARARRESCAAETLGSPPALEL